MVIRVTSEFAAATQDAMLVEKCFKVLREHSRTNHQLYRYSEDIGRHARSENIYILCILPQVVTRRVWVCSRQTWT